MKLTRLLATRVLAPLLAVALPLQASPELPLSRSAAKGSDADDTYLRYAHAPIRTPIPDLLDLTVPSDLGNSRLAALGYVDVTAAPFGADPSGSRDATEAIQAAVNFARDHQMTCFFPCGTYRLSDTLSCCQHLYTRTNGRTFGGNRFPCVLVGSRAGRQRPKLLLTPRAAGFSDPAAPKIFVYFWSRGYANPTTADRVTDGLPPLCEQPNIGMNQMLVNLDIAIGEGNPGAVALRHQAAEGSAIEECTIDATHGHTGIQGGIGSGGSSADVRVIGGRFGLDFTGYLSGTQPTPVITGFTLTGQTDSAIRSTSRQTLVAAGLTIDASRCAGPPIQVGRDVEANHGQLSLIDSVIDFGAAPAATSRRTAIDSACGVYLDNVFVRGASQVLSGPPSELPGRTNGWLHVRRFAAPAEPRNNQGLTYRYPVYAGGAAVARVSETDDGAPPSSLRDRHLWASPFPSFETPGAADVKAPPYCARGDGSTDDAAALQRAIDEREVVFLPKGCYRLSKTLELRPCTKLIGVGQTQSLLVPAKAGAFSDAAKPAPLVRTAEAADAATVLAFLGLHTPSDIAGAQSLHWRCGGASIFRGVEINGRQSVEPAPVLISGHGGGNWYNFRNASARLFAEGTPGPLRFYQFSVQQVTSRFVHASHVAFFGCKYEGNDPVLTFEDCDFVHVFGHGGNGKGRAGASLYVFERTPNFLLANGVDGPTKIGSKSLSHRDGSTDPRAWNFLIDRPTDSPALALPPLERPVLYLRGAPESGR